MKTLLTLGLLMSLTFAAVAESQAAFDPNWIICIKASTSADGVTNASTSVFGVRIDAHSEPGPEDMFAGSNVYAYSYNSGARLTTDIRESPGGNFPLFRIRIGCTSSPVPPSVYLFIWNPADNFLVKTNDFESLNGESIIVYKATGNYSREMIARLDPNYNGNGRADDPHTIRLGPLPVNTELVMLSGPIGGPYWDLPESPEPSSLLALLCGCAGIIPLRKLAIRTSAR